MSRGCQPGGRVRLWTLEITSIAVSVALVVALITTLAYFNRKAVFDSRIITLNTIVSVLSSASKAFLLYSAANCIRQWNWILFTARPRRLYDFERVTDASRGPLGSLRLLGNINFRGGVVVRFGALAVVLTIARDPLAQQLVQIDQEMRFEADNDGQVRVPCAERYSKGSSVAISNLGDTNVHANSWAQLVNDDGRLMAMPLVFADADFGLQAAVIFGITAGPSAISQQIAFNCPSAKCGFTSSASLAVCSQCADLKSHLERKKDSDENLSNRCTVTRSTGFRMGFSLTTGTARDGALNGIFSNIGASMSNAIRNGADKTNGSQVSGSIGVVTTVYAVDWRWIVLHCVTELAALAFLGLTIWFTLQPGSIVPAWKSSEIAVLSQGAARWSERYGMPRRLRNSKTEPRLSLVYCEVVAAGRARGHTGSRIRLTSITRSERSDAASTSESALLDETQC
ncbi:hypothetical protein QBC46DRAFT_407821 [Diplogelasinospora grovesii]|uniref:Uncharacterized protein n=1 Tax=Diplogelasinospora grovesii TaxID=303347 RepID=A0AAN6NAW6_9PEZI|nr:hypothetical protein QBC46DRAFT_407821 [Diplogelasinospora grovesii]